MEMPSAQAILAGLEVAHAQIGQPDALGDLAIRRDAAPFALAADQAGLPGTDPGPYHMAALARWAILTHDVISWGSRSRNTWGCA